MALLEVEQAYKAFQGFLALAGVSLRVEEGRFHALVGPNGAGKTTLFNLITGRYPLDRGEIRFAGRRISGLPTSRIVRLGLAVSFQRAQPFLSFRVEEAVLLGALGYQGHTLALFRPLGQFPEAVKAAREALEKVGLLDQAQRRVKELPLGDLKRLDIAIALVARPRLLLLDEPLAGLSRAERRRMVGFIRDLLRAEGVTLLFTEHDTESVMELADRITVLHQGRVLAEGTPEEIRGHPEVRAAFLGGGA